MSDHPGMQRPRECTVVSIKKGIYSQPQKTTEASDERQEWKNFAGGSPIPYENLPHIY
jgi:hypothetical protein